MSLKIANFMLLIVTAAWSSSYLFTKIGVETLGPFTIVTYRFAIAFLVAAVFLGKHIKQTNIGTLAASAILGVLLCLVSALFGYALKITDASTAGFLISTTVLFVPVLMAIKKQKLPSRQVMLGCVVTLIGLAMFSYHASFSITKGALLCILTAFLYAVHIVMNNLFVRHYNGLQLGVYQLGFGCVFAFFIALILESVTLPNIQLWPTIFGLAIISTAFPAITQSAIQKFTTAEHTGFIFSLEPIFTALLAFVFLRERMHTQEMIGALCIFLGVCIANYVSNEATNAKKEIY